MKFVDKKAVDVKIAYIGGGSQGWAWGLMNDLALNPDMSGDVALYDINLEAAKRNEIIGNSVNDYEGCISKWNYKAYDSIDEALTGADFVVISILPGTMEEMRSDVHTPEKYGIWQPVGDTTGPGGIIRALRTIPMFEVIANAVKKNCPDAWVINYTNPMTVCIRTLYRVFPEIKAFGCCHEVFGTQKLLAKILKFYEGIEADRTEIKTNIVGINHFTWLTSAQYKNIDLFPMYRKYIEEHPEGWDDGRTDHWVKVMGSEVHLVKFDLFKRYGYIAAAGDRHLSEFCEGKWYLESPEMVADWKFGLTTVDKRIYDYKVRDEKGLKLMNGEKVYFFTNTGEEGVLQMRALLGLTDSFVTNINIPNKGQIPNLPLGAVVETNACITSNSVEPVYAGNVPMSIYGMIARIVSEQEMVVEAGLTRDLELAFGAFANSQNVNLSLKDARALFNEMVENTKEYLKDYNV